MENKVSVIVPVYNGERYIERCIKSLLKQTYKNIEIVIVNDGSTDNTENIISKYLKNDTKIKYIKKNNSGVSDSRNLGIYKSSGDYIMFVDSDDYVKAEYAEEMIMAIKDNQADIVCCGYTDVSDYGVLELNDFYKGSNFIEEIDFYKSIFQGVGGVLWNKIFKKEIIIKNKILMDKDIFMCEDMIFVLKYAKYCTTYKAIDKNLYIYNRLNDDSVSKNINLSYYKNLIEVISRISDVLLNSNLNIDNSLNMDNDLKRDSNLDINNNLKNKFIDEVLAKRIKEISFSFLVLQHKKSLNYSMKEKKNNIKQILNNQYYLKYKNKFIYINSSEKLVLKYSKEKLQRVYINSYIAYSMESLRGFMGSIKRDIKRDTKRDYKKRN